MIEADEETQRALHRLLAAFRKADLHGLAVRLNGRGPRTPWAFKRRLDQEVKILLEIRPPLEGQARLIAAPMADFEALLNTHL